MKGQEITHGDTRGGARVGRPVPAVMFHANEGTQCLTDTPFEYEGTDAPQGVSIKYANGKEVECPIKYRGYEEHNGGLFHVWVVCNEGPYDYRDGDRCRIKYLPTNTMVICPGTGPADKEKEA